MSPEEGNVDILKMKLHYMVRNSKDLVGKVTKNLVNEGKVFHKNFEMIRKIDEFMLTNKNRTGKINFPMLVDQMRKDRLSRKEERRERGKSMIGYNSFG